jgi:hypothetical protein
VGKKQVHTILKESEGIYKRWRGGNVSQIKKKLKSYSSQIEEFVYEWFCAARYKNAPISGPLIQEKALEAARALNFGGFKASNGWLHKFKIRHNIRKSSLIFSLEYFLPCIKLSHYVCVNLVVH